MRDLNYSGSKTPIEHSWKRAYIRSLLGKSSHEQQDYWTVTFQSKIVLAWLRNLYKTKLRLYAQKVSTVLDIGCATGELTQLLKCEKNNLYAVDYVEDFIALARQNYDQIKFLVGDLYSLKCSFAGEKFELIVSCGVFQNISDPQRALKEIKDVYQISQHSKLIIVTLLKESVFHKSHFQKFLCWFTNKDIPNHFLYSKDEWQTMLSLYFEEITLEEVCVFEQFFGWVLKYPIFCKLKKLLSTHLYIEAR